MLNLYEGEKIIAVFHRHWVTAANKIVLALLSLIVPFLALVVVLGLKSTQLVTLLTFYLASIYGLVAALIAFILWFNYYMDIWIITNVRIIDAEQKNLFHRETSEFLISRIQDITTETSGFVATLFHYGTLRVQTAGEKGFEAKNIPNVDRVKDIILSEVRKSDSRVAR